MKKILKILALLLAFNANADMLVDDIRIEGLQRVSLGSVLDTVPITIGDRIEEIINVLLKLFLLPVNSMIFNCELKVIFFL